MDELRYLFGGALLLFGTFIVITNCVRQISNLRNRKKGGRWSSPAPIVGPLFIIVGYAALPVEYSNWILLAVILDPDTVIVALGLPSFIKALRE
jgi:uncharacterized membrane protein HdeD (DUF308 family)